MIEKLLEPFQYEFMRDALTPSPVAVKGTPLVPSKLAM